MARIPRLHIPRGIYYVQLRVNGDAPLFPGPDDQGVFESLVARALSRSGAQLHAYAWLRTSANLLIQVDNVALGRIIQGIAGPFARVVNKRLSQRGHRFEHPHSATLVQPDDVLEVVGRLHRMALEPDAPPRAGALGSHTAYLGERVTPWLTRELVHDLLRARGLTARAGYRKFMREGEAKHLIGKAAGDPGKAGHSVNEAPVARWLTERAQAPRISLPELVDAVAKRLGIDPAGLRSVSRRRYLSFARAVIAWYATNGHIATLTDVARYFVRDPSTISAGVARYQREKPEFFLLSVDEFFRGTTSKVANSKGR